MNKTEVKSFDTIDEYADFISDFSSLIHVISTVTFNNKLVLTFKL